METMLSVNNLSCGYDGIDVVKNLSFSISKGERICIVGPNGCGKTTVLRAISGLIPYQGNVSYNGINISSMKRKDISKGIAFMTQMANIYFSYSIYETVALGRYLNVQKNIFLNETKQEKEFVLSCLDKVGLLEIKDKAITQLSGGQLQRVYLARVFAQEPKIILLDEPTNHLDLKHQLELIEHLKEWSQEKDIKRSVIGVMHDLNLAMQLADKVLLMDKGKCVAFGDTKEILKGDEINKAYKVDIKDYMRNSLSFWNE